jgi:uncharacterized protein YukJ
VPLSAYGVLKARAVAARREGAADSPHYQIHLADETGIDYRAAVNVKSKESPSELLYLVDDDLQHLITTALTDLATGWHRLAAHPGGPNLDFVRANLFDPAKMRVLPPDVAGPDNDLADLLDHYVQRAIGDPTTVLYVFGQRFGPEPAQDKVFGFRPGNGVHDIHMNQGNSAEFERDDGVWQDGGLLVHLTGEARWVGIFLAFQGQAWHTDDTTGHALDQIAPPPTTSEPPALRILAAMVNPAGPAPEEETVLLLNASPEPVDLAGWRIADRLKNSCAVPGGPLAAGATRQVTVVDGLQLGNGGGSITLLDAGGLKVSGVSYTAEQARREGWMIVF